MMIDSAIDAQRSASERTASVCPECDAPPGSAHAPDCVLRPKIRYDDSLEQRYGRGDGNIYLAAGRLVSVAESPDTA